MLDLTNCNLRLRDIRKIVEPSFYKVEWEKESDNGSEWVHIKSSTTLNEWISKLAIKANEVVFSTDKSWSKSASHDWQFVSDNLLHLIENGFTIFISQHKAWVLETNSIGVARFGFWR